MTAATMQRAYLSILPVVLILLFTLVPSVSSRIFAAFVCTSFGSDDEREETVIQVILLWGC